MTVEFVELQADHRTDLRIARPVLSFDEARDLAAQFGTPLLVFSRSVLSNTYRELCLALPNVEFFYAAKSNPHKCILRTVADIGCSIDVCSYGEMKQALECGFSAGAMIHTHPCKTIENLSSCYAAGIRWFTFDSETEITKLVRYAPDASLLLRLAVCSRSSVVNLSAKFGVSVANALPLLQKARAAGLNVRGIAFHVGSQCLSPDDFRLALLEARRVYDEASEEGFNIEVLDIGGGMPVPYRNAVRSLECFAYAIREALEETFSDVPIRLIAEPGRVLSADAVTLVTTVIGKSCRQGLPWYIIDDGLYGSFSGKLYDHADYPLIVDDQMARQVSNCVVSGPSCDSSDVVARDQQLPDLDVGEILLVPTMGAYTSASATGFNGLEPARLVEIP